AAEVGIGAGLVVEHADADHAVADFLSRGQRGRSQGRRGHQGRDNGKTLHDFLPCSPSFRWVICKYIKSGRQDRHYFLQSGCAFTHMRRGWISRGNKSCLPETPTAREPMAAQSV